MKKGITKPHIGTCGKWWCEEHQTWHPSAFSRVTYRHHVITFAGPVQPSSDVTVLAIELFKKRVDEKIRRAEEGELCL